MRRAPRTEKVNYAKRDSYLIDPEGVIAKSQEIGDVNAHADMVLRDRAIFLGRLIRRS